MIAFVKYITGVFLEYLIIVWFGFTALLQIFDLLSNSGEIVDRFPGSLSALLIYSLWRLPEIASFLLPFSVLMALLLALSRMEKNNEILAFKAAGGPYSFILFSLLPSVLGIALLHFALSDQVVPFSIAQLEKNGMNIEKKHKRDQEGIPLWRRDGTTIVRVADVGKDGNLLVGVSVFERDRKGGLISRSFADRAIYHASDTYWELQNIRTVTLDTGEQGKQYIESSAIWRSGLTPNDFADLSERPQGLPISQITPYASGDKIGARPAYFYQTWLFRRLFLPFTSLLMILLAAPVASSLQIRGRNLAYGIGAGFLLGFLYFIADGLSTSLGESGALPPILAAGMPLLIFASLGGIALIRAEGY